MKNVVLSCMVIGVLAAASVARGAVLFSDDFESDTVKKPPAKWTLSSNNMAGASITTAVNPSNSNKKFMRLDMVAGATTPNKYAVSSPTGSGSTTEKVSYHFDFCVDTFASDSGKYAAFGVFAYSEVAYNAYVYVSRKTDDTGSIKVWGPRLESSVVISDGGLSQKTWYHVDMVLDPVAHTYQTTVTDRATGKEIGSASMEFISSKWSETDQYLSIASPSSGLSMHSSFGNVMIHTGDMPEQPTKP